VYNYFHCPSALLPEGWRRNVLIGVDDDGFIRSIGADQSVPPDGCRLPGPVLPGMVNAHSHAFQRLMAGLAERPGGGEDSFWSWRERMYALVARLTPDHVQAIARYLYIEMLKAGYTAVAEFQYLHHDDQGRPYAEPAEMALRVAAAADAAGLPMTLLPVLYSYAGFGGCAPSTDQRRFIHDGHGYIDLQERLRSRLPAGQRLGLTFHSLRAVSEAQMRQVLTALPETRPIHIHIAEQQLEVDDCLAWCGQRPVEYLLERFAVDSRWALVHATHMNEHECDALARSGACAVLCPTTEASLGDGFFPAPAYMAAGGASAIGSDSHVSVSVLEELRWLEYGQRLLTQKRNRLHAGGEVGTYLYQGAARGGAMAADQPTGELAEGQRADFVVLDGDHPLLAGCRPEQTASRWLFAGSDSWIQEVWVAGRRVVSEGHHPLEFGAGQAFAETATALLDQ
jgi:formimidoylglutamate deiminase